MDKKQIIATHSGSFHPDDVFAVAALLIHLGTMKTSVSVIRTRDESIIKNADFAVDVGGEHNDRENRFDHHQEGGAGTRKSGIPYASFGLVWAKYGKDIAGSTRLAEAFERRVVQPIDAADNGIETFSPVYPGVSPYLVYNVIFSYLPTWKDKFTADSAFAKAVDFAVDLIRRELRVLEAFIDGEDLVISAYEHAEDKRIIELDNEYMWSEVMSKYSKPLFVVYPNDGTYHVKAVRSDPSSFKTRILFPEEWAGRRGSELAIVSGVPDAIFCHNKRFIVVAKTKEGALALAKSALEQAAPSSD